MAVLDSPAAQRNKVPIWNILLPHIKRLLQERKDVKILEIAGGTGVHASYFCEKIAELLAESSADGLNCSLEWYATDPEASSRQSINERLTSVKRSLGSDDSRLKIHPALSITLGENGVLESDKQGDPSLILKQGVDMIICINMIHISPWEATVGLMKIAGESLNKNGILYCYGPYKENGTAVQSNLAFDYNLKSRNSGWGVRNLEDVVNVAEGSNLCLIDKVEMPANNLSVIYSLK